MNDRSTLQYQDRFSSIFARCCGTAADFFLDVEHMRCAREVYRVIGMIEIDFKLRGRS